MTKSNKRVLIAVTSHAVLGSTGKKTGAYLPEIAHPYEVLRAQGVTVDFVSPKGGEVPLDGVDRKDPSNAAFLDDADAVAKLHASKRPTDVRAEDYDAIFFAGGHGTMWDFADNAALADIAGKIYDRGGSVAAVCHGPAALVNVRLANGKHLVDGKTVAAFTNDEERAVGLAEVVPFLLSDKLRERGAKLQHAAMWQNNVAVSERLVTGQNPASARGVGEALATLLR